MTAAKSLKRKEVDKVTAALFKALSEECPNEEEQLRAIPLTDWRPTSKRGKALCEAYRRAWAASVRFSRREHMGLASKRGLGAAFFDDRRTDVAIASLERARTLVRNARESLQRDMTRIGKERARHGLTGDDHGRTPEHVEAIERIEEALDVRLTELKTFQGIPQARTQSEWDEFLSETARNLLVAGFATREVAGLLTGKKPEAVDRATLERFRQRVSRLGISRG
jgi:hypothetical protein